MPSKNHQLMGSILIFSTSMKMYLNEEYKVLWHAALSIKNNNKKKLSGVYVRPHIYRKPQKLMLCCEIALKIDILI